MKLEGKSRKTNSIGCCFPLKFAKSGILRTDRVLTHRTGHVLQAGDGTDTDRAGPGRLQDAAERYRYRDRRCHWGRGVHCTVDVSIVHTWLGYLATVLSSRGGGGGTQNSCYKPFNQEPPGCFLPSQRTADLFTCQLCALRREVLDTAIQNGLGLETSGCKVIQRLRCCHQRRWRRLGRSNRKDAAPALSGGRLSICRPAGQVSLGGRRSAGSDWPISGPRRLLSW